MSTSTRAFKQLLFVCLLAGLALAGLVALPARAAAPPFEFAWGELGAAEGEFNNPAGVAATGDGKIVYVADSYNHRIQKFNVDHTALIATFATSWGTTGIPGTADGEFNTPSAVAVDGSGNVYVADTNNHRIQVNGGSGFVTKWGSGSPGAGDTEFDTPSGVAASGTYVFIADSRNNRIKVYDSSSEKLVYSWGVAGSGDGEFNNPVGVAADGAGYVYVADSDNNRIQKFAVDSVTATFVISWGTAGTLLGQFTRPTGVAVDASNNVYVADSGNNRIQVFDSSGGFVTTWGGFGSGDGEFMLVSGVAVDGDGHSYIADTGNSRIQEFGALSSTPPSPTPSALALVGEWGQSGSENGNFNTPTDMALDGDGNVYVVDAGNGRIQKFDRDGEFSTTWGSKGPDLGQFNSPTSIAVSGTHVYVADQGNGRVQVFNTGGGFEASWPFTSPAGIALDSAGNIYVADSRYNLLYKRDSNGGPIMQWGGPGMGDGQFYAIGDVAVNTAGQILVADAEPTGPRVQEFTNTGGFLAKFGGAGTGNGQFFTPASLSIDRGGNIYVADSGNIDHPNGRIQQFGSDNGYLFTIDDSALTGHGTFNGPRGVAVTGDGSLLYVADTGNNRILKFGLAAPPTYVRSFGEYGSGDGQFNMPGGIAVDNPLSALSAGQAGAQAVGYVYVADTLNSRVQRFTSLGVFVSQWSSWWPYSPTDRFSAPGGVAYSSFNKWVYVADTFFNRIVYFTPSGGYLGQWGTKGTGPYQFDHPVGVAVDALGYVYVTDTGNNRVEKFNSVGSYRYYSWGPTISGLNPPLKRPSGVAVDSLYNVYISDTGNHRIVELDSKGNLVRTWGSLGGGDDQFNGPVGITLGGGFATIADTGNNRLMKYSTDGKFIAQVGTRGSAPGQFNNVTGVVYDGYGNVYAADTNNHTVKVFESVWLTWLPVVFKTYRY